MSTPRPDEQPPPPDPQASEFAKMSLNEAGYASVPPTGTYSTPTSQPGYNDQITPTAQTFPQNYPSFAEDGSTQYVYYTPTPQMTHVPPPPFSPGGPDGMGMGYPYGQEMMSPVMPNGGGGMDSGLTMAGPGVSMPGNMPNGYGLGEAFMPSGMSIERSATTEGHRDGQGESWKRESEQIRTPFGRRASASGTGGAIYQPPHIQRLIEQQQQARAIQAQAQAQVQAVAASGQNQPAHMWQGDSRGPVMFDATGARMVGFQTLAEDQMEWWRNAQQHQHQPPLLQQHPQHLMAETWRAGPATAGRSFTDRSGMGESGRGGFGLRGRGGARGSAGNWRGGDRRKDYAHTPHIPYSPSPRYNNNHAPSSSFSPSSMRSSHHSAPSQSFNLMSPALSHRNGGSSHLYGAQGAMPAFGPQFGGPQMYNGGPRPYVPRNSLKPPGSRSSLLEDFRLNKIGRAWSINHVRGHIVEFSMDQHGSRFIQQRLENVDASERQKIWDEVLPSAYTLMTDVFGNYVIQKMFEVGHAAQRAKVAGHMEGQVVFLSNHMYGCRVVQKALDHLAGEARMKVIKELEPKFLDMVVANNGNHVIQRLVAVDPPESLGKAFIGHLNRLATNPYACRVVQKMFEQMPEGMKRPLLDELHPLVGTLMQDQFGNYVVQSVITEGPEEDRKRIIARLKGQMLPMSRHKFASNVCEKALLHADVDERRGLVDELLDEQPDGTTKVPMLLRDAFGNFPLQTALTTAPDDQRVKLLDLIIPVLPQIRTTPVGKRLEARFAQWEADGMIKSATEAGANTLAHLESQALEQAEIDAIEARHRELVEEHEDAETASSRSDSVSTEVTSPEMGKQGKGGKERGSSSTPNRSVSRSARGGRIVWDAGTGRQFEKADSMVTVMPEHEANDERTLKELLR